VIEPDADGWETELASLSVLLIDFAYKFGLTSFKHSTLLAKWQLIVDLKCQRSKFV
jgi:hypothetical protein